MPGVLTYSGRLVSLDGLLEPPSLADIGLGLSRMPRFAGQTRRWWTVAHHVLWLEDYARQNGHQRDARLGILLHDAHEAITGDIPTHFKTPDLKEVQHSLDAVIFDRYHPRFWLVRDYVKHYDRLSLMAEAVTVGPPGLDIKADPVGVKKILEEHFMGLPVVEQDNNYLRDWITGHLSLNHPDGDGVEGLQREFIRRVVELL